MQYVTIRIIPKNAPYANTLSHSFEKFNSYLLKYSYVQENIPYSYQIVKIL